MANNTTTTPSFNPYFGENLNVSSKQDGKEDLIYSIPESDDDADAYLKPVDVMNEYACCADPDNNMASNLYDDVNCGPPIPLRPVNGNCQNAYSYCNNSQKGMRAAGSNLYDDTR